MKKKALIAVMAMALVMTACGGNAASSESSAAAEVSDAGTQEASSGEDEEELPETEAQNPMDDLEPDETPVVEETVTADNIEEFVKIEDYHGKKLTKYITAVTDEDVDERVASDLEIFTVEMPADTVIEDGMVANIDYVGTVDGAEFENGSAEDYDLLIGSHFFVDDFEEQLIGAKKGDEVEVIVNFPEDYGDKLSGKEAHFAVTINGVKQSLTEPTDEWVAANTEYQTVAEYYEGIRAEIQSNYDYDSDSELRSGIWEEIMDSAEFYKYPQELVDKYAAMVREQFEYMASAYYNATLDTFMQENGITEDYFAETGKDYVKRELVADCILFREGEPLDTPKMEEMVSELLALNGIASREEANEWGVSDTQIDYAALNNVAAQLVIDSAEVTEVDSAEREDLTEDPEITFDDEDAEEEDLKGTYEEESSGE